MIPETKIKIFFCFGILPNTPRLMSDYSMPLKEVQMHGHLVDGLQTVMHQTSTENLTFPNTTQFATPPRPTRWLNLATLSPSFASNGPISWFARLETSHFLNKVWSTPWVTLDWYSRPFSLQSFFTSHSWTSPLPLDRFLSHTSLYQASPSTLLSSSMTRSERFGSDLEWSEKAISSDLEDGLSKTHTTDYNDKNYNNRKL